VLSACAALAGAASLRAHTPDTSYARVAIAREAVTFTFTLDLASLARVAPLDADRDGKLTPTELAAAAPAIEAFLRRTVFPELNEREAAFGVFAPLAWPANAGDFLPAADFGQRLVACTFRNEVLHAPDAVALTFDFFRDFGERHTVLGNFVWDARENPVVFTRLEPDYLFDTGYAVPAWEQFCAYVRLGVAHIFRGYDHLAFLLAQLFVRRLVDLLKIISAFTVAHTLTLALAALQVVSLPSRLVESAIAASIMWVALENLRGNNENSHRWRITFALGLVHGFGFATVLRELGLPAEGLVRSLLAFNLGVELGQLAIAAACWPVLRWIASRVWAERFRATTAAILLVLGAAWLADRALALRLMPF
jgi:hydrogenase/urease accessory protein HupE